jgi:hypothetical protein
MSYPAQLAFLSKLDATAFPPSTIFVFTYNATDSWRNVSLAVAARLNSPATEWRTRLWAYLPRSGTRKLAAQSGPISSESQKIRAIA